MFKLGNMMSFIDISINYGEPGLGDVLNGDASVLLGHTYSYKHSNVYGDSKCVICFTFLSSLTFSLVEELTGNANQNTSLVKTPGGSLLPAP